MAFLTLTTVDLTSKHDMYRISVTNEFSETVHCKFLLIIEKFS